MNLCLIAFVLEKNTYTCSARLTIQTAKNLFMADIGNLSEYFFLCGLIDWVCFGSYDFSFKKCRQYLNPHSSLEELKLLGLEKTEVGWKFLWINESDHLEFIGILTITQIRGLDDTSKSYLRTEDYQVLKENKKQFLGGVFCYFRKLGMLIQIFDDTNNL